VTKCLNANSVTNQGANNFSNNKTVTPKTVNADSGNKSTGEEFRFRVVFKFSRDINTSKLGSKTAIFKEIVDNFARLGKKLVGVLEVYLKDSRNIVAL